MTATDTIAVELGEFGELTVASRAGGQGRVHRPTLHPDGLEAGPLVVKLYRRRVGEQAAAVLHEMVRWERSLPDRTIARLGDASAWPVAVVSDAGRTVGIAMRDMHERFAVPFLMPSGRQEYVLLALEHLLGHDAFLRNRGLATGLDTTARVRVAERISGALACLHQHGIVVGDIAPNNVLVSVAPASACFIDCDSMILRGQRALAPVETGDWELPAAFGEQLGTRAADAYKLGLVVLRLLARSHDARSVGPHLRHLPAEVGELLARALSPDAPNRPPAGEWQRTLAGLLAIGGLELSHPGPRSTSVAPARPGQSQPVRAPKPIGAGAAVRSAPLTPPAAGRVVVAARSSVPARWRPIRSRLTRSVLVLWLIALALALAALVSRLDTHPPAAVTTTFYPQGPGGRVYPSVGYLSAGQSGQP